MELFRAPVSRFMAAPVVRVRADDDLRLADGVLRMHRVSAALVVDRDDRAVGVVSRRDLLRVGRVGANGRRAAAIELPARPVAEIMSRPVISVAAAAPAQTACHTLVERHIHRVFAVDGEAAVGVFSTREALAIVREARVDRPLGDCVRRDLVIVASSAPLSDAVEILEKAGVGGVVVVEGTLPVGLLTEREALLARGRPPATPVEDVMTEALLCLPAATPLFRAAGFALATTARRILVTDRHHAIGVVTGLDFARVVAE